MSDSQRSESTVNVRFEEYVPVPTDDSPEATPSPLEQNPESPTHTSPELPESTPSSRERRPITLHPLVGWGLVVVCYLLIVVVAILYWRSQRRNGLFNVYPARTFRDEVLQLVWSSVPTSLMTLLTGFILAPMAFDLWWYAPYAQLERGGATAQSSILVNYTVLGALERIWRSFRNGKPGLVALGIAVPLAGLLPIAASGLLETKIVVIKYHVSVQITAMPGIWPSTDGDNDGNGNHIFLDSNHYMEAASSAVGKRVYQPLPAPFTYQSSEENWSITPLNQTLPILGHEFDVSTAANLTVETYGIKMDGNCSPANVTVLPNDTAIATLNGCSFNFNLSLNQDGANFTRWHQANSTPCNEASLRDEAFRAFVYILYEPSSSYVNVTTEDFVVMFCQPSMSVAKVSATLFVTRQDGIGALVAPPKVMALFDINNYTSDQNVMGLFNPPLNGNAVNGYDNAEPINETSYSRYVREMITQLLLGEGIYSAMLDQNDVNADWFTSDNRANLQNIISDFYQTYVSTFSRSAYFNPLVNDTIIPGSLTTLATRASIARLNAIALGTLLFLLASLLAFTLATEPRPRHYGDGVGLAKGTLAGHAIASEGHLMEVIRTLSGQPHKRIATELKARRFSMNEGKVVIHS